MRVVEKNLWDAHAEGKTVVITTNGYVNGRGLAVMGRGVARQAAERFPSLPRQLAERIYTEGKTGGNRVHHFQEERIITFPVKHKWFEDADLELICKSAVELVALLDKLPQEKPVAMPKPGCGNGKLKWGDVEPVLDSILVEGYVEIVDLPGMTS